MKKFTALMLALMMSLSPVSYTHLAPILVEQIFDIIRELHAAGTTILLVEQNAQAALSVADRAYVLETGRITLSGTGKELMASDAVRKAYLGG